MGCTRNRSKISADRALVFALLFTLSFPSYLWAAFASRFSLLTGEEYSDNIFFSKSKDHDFITVFTPTLTLLYAPEGEVIPTLSAEISPSYQIYARHSDLTNFDNVISNAGYTYRYSPRLNFSLSDVFRRIGETRSESLFTSGESLTGWTSPPPIGRVTPPPLSQNVSQFTSGGKQATNFVSLSGSYLYRPDISFTGEYRNTFSNFIDAGGTEVFHEVIARGIYNWRQQHNLYAGYTVSILHGRNGDGGVIHRLDIGDDYFTNYTVQLTPTLSLTASSGLSLNTGNSGPRVANDTRITITKLWETGNVNAGVTKGLTPSYGISGISDTTSVFASSNWYLTEKLFTNAHAVFSWFDTDNINFKTFQAGIGIQYFLTTWLSTGLNYRFYWLDSGGRPNQTDLLEPGIVKSNIVFLGVTGRFDIWPNVGLARSGNSSSVIPVLTPPFPVQSPKRTP